MLLPVEAQPLLLCSRTSLRRPPPGSCCSPTRPSSPPAAAQSLTCSAPSGHSPPVATPVAAGCCPPPASPALLLGVPSPATYSDASCPPARCTWSGMTRGRAPRPVGVREGAAPRPGPLVPRVHRTAVRAQVGRPHPAREVPVRRTTLALPVLIDLYRTPEVSRAEGAPPHSGATHVPAPLPVARRSSRSVRTNGRKRRCFAREWRSWRGDPQ
jgi:hypothetical protein